MISITLYYINYIKFYENSNLYNLKNLWFLLNSEAKTSKSRRKIPLGITRNRFMWSILPFLELLLTL